MLFSSIDQLKKAIEGILKIEGDNVRVLDEEKLRGSLIDHLVYSAVLSGDAGVKQAARWLIRRAGVTLGVLPSSIQSLYEAMGRGEVKGFTVPAINIRGLTYETAQAVFRAGLKGSVGPILFEIARSEIGYTEQRPDEYACAITARPSRRAGAGPSSCRAITSRSAPRNSPWSRRRKWTPSRSSSARQSRRASTTSTSTPPPWWT